MCALVSRLGPVWVEALDEEDVMADEEVIDPYLKMAVTVSRVHPFQAVKEYLCPSCSHEIAPGVGHVVVIPIEAVDLRRHWHSGCWEKRNQRRNRR